MDAAKVLGLDDEEEEEEEDEELMYAVSW